MAERKVSTIESKLQKLDEIVEKISSQSLSLDESLSLYEEGKKLIKELESELDSTKEKVEKIIE